MLALSFTVTLKVEAPLVLGVPLITPVAAAKVRPAGNDPKVTVQLL